MTPEKEPVEHSMPQVFPSLPDANVPSVWACGPEQFHCWVWCFVQSAFFLMGLSGISLAQVAEVVATVETKPSTEVGDADDPCIWIHPANPSLSTVIGVDKKKGLNVYDLSGKEIQHVPDGPMNNVDLRYNFPLGGETVTLVTAGNKGSHTIAVYKVNPTTRKLENVASRAINVRSRVYGSCMYHSLKTGKYYFIVNSSRGDVEQWELFDNGQGKVDGELARAFSVGSQTEGCVADDELGHLYISEESVGIWKYDAEPDDDEIMRRLVDLMGPRGHLSDDFRHDVEGLTIYYAGDRTGYLIASSQGNSTYVVYRREGNNDYVTTFRIAAGENIDGAKHTDGLDVTNVTLGSAFPQGVLVVHDGANEGQRPGDHDDTNYKLVPWQSIARATRPMLKIDVSWNPRAAK